MAFILVADDDEIVTDMVGETLRLYGHAVIAVHNGEDALRAIGAKNPDLVILDCNMPQKSGILALRAVRESYEHYTLPILMLSARNSKSDVDIALREGANDYLKKPFDPHEVAFRVDQLLERPRAH